jgi:hypothetical protein
MMRLVNISLLPVLSEPWPTLTFLPRCAPLPAYCHFQVSAFFPDVPEGQMPCSMLKHFPFPAQIPGCNRLVCLLHYGLHCPLG